MIVAGEASGDAHAASLARALQAAAPEKQIDFFAQPESDARRRIDSIVNADELAISAFGKSGRRCQNSGARFGELKRRCYRQKLMPSSWSTA